MILAKDEHRIIHHRPFVFRRLLLSLIFSFLAIVVVASWAKPTLGERREDAAEAANKRFALSYRYDSCHMFLALRGILTTRGFVKNGPCSSAQNPIHKQPMTSILIRHDSRLESGDEGLKALSKIMYFV